MREKENSMASYNIIRIYCIIAYIYICMYLCLYIENRQNTLCEIGKPRIDGSCRLVGVI